MAQCKVQIRYDKFQDYKRSPYWDSTGRPWYPKGKLSEGLNDKVKDPNACPLCNNEGILVDPRTDLPRLCACGIAQKKAA